MASVRFLRLMSLLILGVWAFQASASRRLGGVPVSEMHERWMSQHGRVYKNEAEKAHRLATFKTNKELIESFNAGDHKFKLGINQFADLTNDEYNEACSGFNPPLMTAVKAAKGFMYENVNDVPSGVDWRTRGAVTPIKHQGHCGNIFQYAEGTCFTRTY
ncbi:senescence-specific cysteine protease SAG39-like [Asparagus officinalis]|uniref:senescence-specific cysteine protease SAG39-like n=1 Tax=Asparagus officinalis TaxID=4686 RepID=UPI00098E572D|nr:senescence-specific cysteine protease SAG39-like [Asparagus officinalis]